MSQRRIVMFNRVSADGYFAAPDGNLNWVVPDDAIDQAGVAGMPQIDTMMFGRRTYEQFESFWPHVSRDDRTAADPHTAGRTSPALRAMATWINETAKVVFSRTRKEVTWNHSRLLSEIDPRQIEAMKNGPGKDIIIFGSGSVVSQLTEHGLIDEFRLVVGPVFLGSGKNMVTGLPKSVRLTLAQAKTYDSGNVILTYTPKR